MTPPPQKKKSTRNASLEPGLKRGGFFRMMAWESKIDGVRALFEGVGIGPDQYMNCAMFCLNDRRPFFCQAKQHCSRRMLKHHWAHVLHDTFSPFFQQCSPFSLVSCYVMGAKNCSTCLINRLQWLQPVLGILGSNQYSKTTVGSTNAKAQAMWLMLVV